MNSQKAGKGRPPRPPIEVVRVLSWYFEVRRLSKLSETKLEIRFDKLDRAKLGRHRGSRWNKYKAGITTPNRDLLEQVGQEFAGTLQVFDHPVWALAAGTPLETRRFRELVNQLPQELATLVCKVEATKESDFWIKEKIDHISVLTQIQEWQTRGVIGRLTALAGLLTLAHDGRLRQLEAQHFDAHLAVVAVAAKTRKSKFTELVAWRLESLILQDWLKTEYTDANRRRLISELRAISLGPLAPWAPRQASLKLARGPNKKEAADLQSTKGYWVAEKLLSMAATGGWPD